MPLLGPTMQNRNTVFQRLKPPCVELSQAALLLNTQKGDVSQVTRCLENVKRALTSETFDGLDEKLADYVFFPLSHVLKASQNLSLQCLELCLECISILAAHGWRNNIEPQLAAQLVILCTMLADRHPKKFSFSESTDELQIAALTSLEHIFVAVGASNKARELLTSEANFPQLGQTISNILENVENNKSSAVQTAGADALDALMQHLADRELCANFLPGIASRLTRVLTPSTKQRRSPRMLVTSLQILATLIQRTLSDRSTNAVDHDKSLATKVKGATASIIDEPWIENASVQLKNALTSVVRLRSHSRDDVRKALCNLCITVLQKCKRNLGNCSQMALETIITVSSDRQEIHQDLNLEVDLHDPPIQSLLQDLIYGWIQNIPTLMQSADEDAKLARMCQIATAYTMLVRGGQTHSMIDKAILNGLRDAVTLTLQAQSAEVNRTEPQIKSLDLVIPQTSLQNQEFETALVENRNQRVLLHSIENIVRLVDQSSGSSARSFELVRSLRLYHVEAQLSTFWMLLSSAKHRVEQGDDVDEFLAVNDEPDPTNDEQLEELYSFAVTVLTDDVEQYNDPRLHMLALRSLALRAQSVGEDFRYELVDALYPVLHMLATPNEVLQRDSIVALNIIAKACSYASVKELIVANVDYLTNAVALKLNSFDVSPQAPQVLLMMVRLAGPSLLPYLEDTVESIFAALEDYHGYPLLVELLFKVLRVMAEEGVKAPALAIAAPQCADVAALLTDTWRPTSIDALCGLLHERKMEEPASVEALEPHPKRPWKAETDDEEGRIEEVDTDDEASEEEAEAVGEVEKSPPMPKTYNLLLKITELTQHFLPSASLSTTNTLLGLIRITVPAISQHEDSFLPLINTLWPEITARLDDEETNLQSQALEVIAVLCEHAGSFMRSRIVQLWPRLGEIYESVAKEIAASVGSRRDPKSGRNQKSSAALIIYEPSFQRAIAKMQDSPADYSNTTARNIWDSLIKLLTTIADKVQLPPELFDEALILLTPVLDNEDIRSILDNENADAVWLARIKAHSIPPPTPPIVPEGKNWTFAAISVR